MTAPAGFALPGRAKQNPPPSAPVSPFLTGGAVAATTPGIALPGPAAASDASDPGCR
jgi:hypothetical protein